MITYKYTYDPYQRHVAINACACPTYNGVKTENEARVACARKLDSQITAQKEKIAEHNAKMEKELASLTRDLCDLEDLRNSVYVGELPPAPEPDPKPQS